MTDDTTTTDRTEFRPTDAFAPVLDAQRTAIERTRQFTREAIEAQTRGFEATVEAVEATQGVAERNTGFSREAWHTYLEAVEASLPEGAADFEEFHRAVDEGHDAYFESESEAVEAFADALAEGGDAYEEFVRRYADAVDASFETALESLSELEERGVAPGEGAVDVDVHGVDEDDDGDDPEAE